MFAISLTLILSILANHVLCSTKFLRPPEWNSDVDTEFEFEQNIGYEVGDTIQLLWETDLEDIVLNLVQQIGSDREFIYLDESRTEWKAEWDVSGLLKGNEDSVYWFALGDPDDLSSLIAKTQYFNVTAPKLETSTTTTTALQTSTTIQSTSPSRVATSVTEPLPTSTTPDESSESDFGPDSDSGMSKGKIAGAAVGGTIGSLLLIGAVGWLAWRRLGRSKKNTEVSVVSQGHQQHFDSSETKAELPGDPAVEVYAPGYARSPPGLHEAP
ncbi:hypothetical protein FGADI_2045 [Fusarium gaditjirri]|uniref:Mid2 domain-containing protein n=1 Tax=Fusarium gaditjirri TaxID=282569 RepID=A0A8H4X2W9_9HYPO|nr:hypothetical protein FGADI_2045 [Fusarium gaditjirri]